MVEKQINRNLPVVMGKNDVKPKKMNPVSMLPIFYQPTNALELELEKERQFKLNMQLKTESANASSNDVNHLLEKIDQRLDSARGKFLPAFGSNNIPVSSFTTKPQKNKVNEEKENNNY